MATYQHLGFDVPSGLSWFDVYPSFGIETANSTTIIIANTDGTKTFLVGTGFTFGSPAGGTITAMARTNGLPAPLNRTLETVTGLSIPLGVLGSVPNKYDLFNLAFAGADSLTGYDAINGLSGADFLLGGPGADTLNGGTGSDYADYISAQSGVTANLTNSLANTGDAAGDSYISIENLRGSAFADVLVGDSGANILKGSDGDDTLSGLDGDDTLDGGVGADTMNGGVGNDTYVFDDFGDAIVENENEGTDTVKVIAVSYTLPANVENLTFFALNSAETGIGNALANVLTSGPNTDSLSGLEGDDTLDGGAGADQMFGGQGNDTYVVDDAGDVVTELADQGTDTVQTTLGTYTLGANVENLTFSNNAIHVGFGNGLANVFTGSDGDDTFVGHVDIFEQVTDTMNGGLGNDTFIGEFSDIINGGAGTDFLFAVNSNPWNIDLGATSIEWMSAGFGSDTINAATQAASVEVFAGGGNDTVTGSAFNDFLWLGAGNDTAVGGNGNDMLFGDIGADSLSGGDGNDNLYADAADTLISGGNGTDNLYWTENAVGANIDMAATSLEWAQTLGGNDTLNGATGSANLEVYAGAGTDIITGGSGNDFLWGEGGNDTISGNGGSDTLVGGTGADTLTGGAGLDTLYANSGNGADGALDTFVFTAGWGTDFVYDFENGTDKFDMTALGTNFGALTVTTVGPHAQVSLGGNTFIVVNGAGLIDTGDFLF